MFTKQKAIAPKLELSNEILCILVAHWASKWQVFKVGGPKNVLPCLGCHLISIFLLRQFGYISDIFSDFQL